jgi:hypothetical protein
MAGGDYEIRKYAVQRSTVAGVSTTRAMNIRCVCNMRTIAEREIKGRLAYPAGIGLLAAFVMVVLTACDSNALQEAYRIEAEQPPHGITRTDDGGRILMEAGRPIEVDSTDWQTSPAYAGRVRFDPAYPNPTSGELVTVPFVIPFSNAIPGGLLIRGFSNTGRFVLLDEVIEASQTGAWSFVFSPSLLSASGDIGSIQGLHRLFVFDFSGELVSYGDLLVE